MVVGGGDERAVPADVGQEAQRFGEGTLCAGEVVLGKQVPRHLVVLQHEALAGAREVAVGGRHGERGEQRARRAGGGVGKVRREEEEPRWVGGWGG